MARTAGHSGRVLGIERSPEQIRAAVRAARAGGEGRLVEWRRGDALGIVRDLCRKESSPQKVCGKRQEE